jgi:exosortase/archaeosortase family protein
MNWDKLELRYLLIGVGVLALSLFLPRSEDFLVFLMLLGWLGVFTIIFKSASLIPSILLVIYGFSVGFPIVVDPLIGEAAAVANTNIVIAIFDLFRLSIAHEGTILTFTSASGDIVTTVLTTACSGYATLGVFLALFALMMLDVRLTTKRALFVFLFGLIGTWLQNIVRIVITIAAGYYWGSDGLESMHYNISYLIFPLWFGLFVYVYLRVARRV